MVWGCKNENSFSLKTAKDLHLKNNTPLILGFDSIGYVKNVLINDSFHVYKIVYDNNVELRIDAQINSEYPLAGDNLIVRIGDAGTGLPLKESDTVQLILQSKNGNRKGIIDFVIDSISGHSTPKK
jgi:hypothetical protein